MMTRDCEIDGLGPPIVSLVIRTCHLTLFIDVYEFTWIYIIEHGLE